MATDVVDRAAQPERTRPSAAAPLGLALLLERGGVTLVAPPQALAPGLDLLELTATVPGARPSSAGGCRGRACGASLLRLRIGVEEWVAWVRGRLVGAAVPGWRIEHVVWDMAEGTGGAWEWTLRGREPGGAPVWLRIEMGGRSGAGRLWLRPRRCWLLGPRTITAERTWRALARRLVGPGVVTRGGVLEIDVLRAALGGRFAGAGWALPGGRGLGVEEVRVADWSLRVTLRAGVGERSWPEGQVGGEPAVGAADGSAEGQVRGGAGEDSGSCPEGQVIECGDRAGFDPLAGVRESDAVGSRWVGEVPGLAAEVGRRRALGLRFVDRDACVAALGEWSRARPEDAEARWLLVVQQALRGEEDGLIAALAELARLKGSLEVVLRRRLALALALARRDARDPEARALLEAMVLEVGAGPEELQAAVWGALARVRAADADTPGRAVEAAVAAALGEEGWRRRGEAGELRAQVAAALVGSGRGEAETMRILRRMLGDERPGRRGVPAGERRERAPVRAAARDEDPRASARIVADYYAQEGRWSQLVTLLERELVHLEGAAKVAALQQIARIHRFYLKDPASAEQALLAADGLVAPAGIDVED